MISKQSQFFGYVPVLCAGILLLLSTPIENLNHKSLDLQFQLLRSWSNHPQNNVVVIGLDQAALDQYREPLAIWHQHVSAVFKALALSSPKAVVVDLILPDKSYEFVKKGLDRQLLSGILILKDKAPLIIAQTLDREGKYRPLFAPIVSLLEQNHIGLALVKTEPDQVVRQLLLSVDSNAGSSPTLSGVLAEQMNLDLTAGYIDYSIGQPYTYIPLTKVLDWLNDKDKHALNLAFSDKVVFVGSVLPFVDRHLAPIPLAAWEDDNHHIPGVLIHAQSTLTLLNKSSIQLIPNPVLMLLSFILSLSWFIAQRPVYALGIALIVILILPAISTWMLTRSQWLPVSGLLLVVFVSITARLILESYFTWREKRQMRESFSRYVSPQVMDDILEHRIQPGVGGSRTLVCVLFADIRNFTRRSEGVEPEVIIELLNRYFNRFSASIHQYGGTVDKYIGDGLMAFFGAPNPQEKAASMAFSASRDMLEKLQELNRELTQEDIEPIQIGIGLHFGEAIIGHVGSDSRYEYTAIGDTVNLASRLESLTKQLGFPIVCSQAVCDSIDEPLVALGKQPVKGHTSVPVFGWKPSNANEAT